MGRKRSPIPYLAALALGIVLFFVSGPRRGYVLTDLLFSLASGALIVGLVRLLSNMKMFASMSWGTRLLKRVFLNRAGSAKDESAEYIAYRSSRRGHADALPLLIAFAVLTLLSLAAAPPK